MLRSTCAVLLNCQQRKQTLTQVCANLQCIHITFQKVTTKKKCNMVKNVRTASSLISQNIFTSSQSMNTGNTYRFRYLAVLFMYFACAIKYCVLFVLKHRRDKFDNSLIMWDDNSSNQRNLTRQSSFMTINSCWQFVSAFFFFFFLSRKYFAVVGVGPQSTAVNIADAVYLRIL